MYVLLLIQNSLVYLKQERVTSFRVIQGEEKWKSEYKAVKNQTQIRATFQFFVHTLAKITLNIKIVSVC